MNVTTTRELNQAGLVFVDPTVPFDAVDMSVLRGLVGPIESGMSDLVVELIDIYTSDASRKLESMRLALAFGDMNSLRRTSHGLKGSSSSLGAFQLAALFNGLEASTNELSSQDLGALLSGVEKEYERVCQVFAAERNRRVS